jgi:hypothetical protein
MKKSVVIACLSAMLPFLFGSQCGNPTQAKEKIVLTSPASGQKVCAGDTLLVSWTQSVSSAKVSYNFNRGGGWVEFASVTKVDNNSVKAVLPVTFYTDSFQVKVEDNSGTLDAGTSSLFSLKYIVISYPTGGETFKVGNTVTIRFKACADKVSSLRFKLSADNGASFGDMLTGSVNPSLTSFDWVVGSEPGPDAPFAYPSSTCILQIRDYTGAPYWANTGVFTVSQ